MRLTRRIEITVLIGAYLAGIVAVGIAARLILTVIGPHPAAAQAVFLTIALLASIGGLIVFSLLVSRVAFLVRGYRVGFRDGLAYYEEREASGQRWEVAFQWFPLTKGFRPRGVVRLPRPEALDVDACLGGGGRLDEIADRITKDLRSYEGWPALVMPQTAIDSGGNTDVCGAFIRGVVEDCPEWAGHVTPGGTSDAQDGVLLSVPPPEQPSQRLQVVHRGESLEIAYGCGKPGLRATARFGLADPAAAVFCVREFLPEVREGEMVVLVRRLDLLTRWRRGVRCDAQFRSVSPSIGYSRYSRWPIYAWQKERRGHC